MKFKSLKTLALIGTALIGAGLIPTGVNAADDADVIVDLETQAGITALTQVDMDFGDWIVGIASGDTATITMAAADGAFTTNEGASSDLVELNGATNGTQGEILVTLPAGADGITVQMTRGAITDFTDAGIELTAINYSNSDNGGQAGTLAEATPVPITVTTGATGATVSFGGTITATATPADNVAHNASFDVAFAY